MSGPYWVAPLGSEGSDQVRLVSVMSSWVSVPAPCVCLVVLDGWGLAEPGPGNAVSLARTPVFDELWQRFAHTTLTACGRAVGLPEGQMGNSEVGHLNLGAGSVVRQDLVRIDDAIADGSFESNEVLRAALSDAPATLGGAFATAAGGKKIVAITSCPTGIAHTFMAGKAHR